MKLLMPLISVKMLKLIPMVLLASIFAISFSLFTSPNAFASQVWESSIAKFVYPDNWNILNKWEDGTGVSFRPFNEPTVILEFTVLQDNASNFVEVVEESKQKTVDTELQIVQIKKDVPGEYVYSITKTLKNGIVMIGLVIITEMANTNDVLLTIYTAETSKFQQYNDLSGFSIYSNLSPLEQGTPQYSTSPEDFLSGYLKLVEEILNDPNAQVFIEYCMNNPTMCPAQTQSPQTRSGICGICNVWPGIMESTGSDNPEIDLFVEQQ